MKTIQLETEGYQPPKSGLLLLQCLVGLLFFIFVIRFWYLQIHRGADFAQQAQANHLRQESVYASRGLIRDVNGVLLAENRPAFGLALIREDCKDINATLAQVSEWANIPLDQLTNRFQQDKRKVKPFEPILLLSDMTFDQVARIEAQLMHWPGLEIVTRSKRYYPEGKEFAHILGYVAEANEQELAADPYLALGDTVGKQGLEYVFEPRLRGHKGLYSVEVDVLGRSLGKTLVEEPQNGENLQLGLDTKLQKRLAELLGDQTGSIVVMEPHTGRLRALVTNPSYDNNLFVGGLSQKTWVALRDDPYHPLQNRAIQSVYPPGSVWKLMMAGLFLKEGVSPSTRVVCTGAVKLGNREFRCWRRGGHGAVDLIQSLMHSCDVYYYVLGEKMGIDRIEAFAKAGADLLSIHLEADHPTRIAQALKVMGECGVKKAVALRPITKAEAILPYLEELDLVLVMTVEPGFGGQAFMESQLDTIRQVRALIERYNPACELEVDGGISPKTAPLVVEAGANVLVAGSAVYGAEDIPAAIQALRVSGGVRGERV